MLGGYAQGGDGQAQAQVLQMTFSPTFTLPVSAALLSTLPYTLAESQAAALPLPVPPAATTQTVRLVVYGGYAGGQPMTETLLLTAVAEVTVRRNYLPLVMRH